MFVSVLLILGMTPSPSFAVEDSDGGSASSAASAAVDQASSDEAEEQQLETLLDVKYVYIESPQIGIGSTQNIVVGLEDGVSLPSDATLFFASGSNSEIFEAPLSRSVSGAMLFEVETNALVEGEYHLIRVESETESTVASIDFAADESDYSFTVTSALSSGEDSDESADLATDTGVSTSVVTTDESGNEVEADSIEEAIDEAGSDNVVTPFSAGESREERSAGRSSRLIVVLDPGHGGYDPGASGNGVQESTVNLKIAQYCRDELSEYQNVTVLMTRESDVYVSLQDRVDYAVSNNADLVVGIHNNSATVSSANGAEVIVPRAGEYHEIGEDLGNLILDQIEALGLERRQVYSKDCTTGDRYDDGTLEDYYTMIAGPREHGITGIIVEHAFVSNGSDASFLKSDANLKRLGVADATAIANYYGLSKHPSLHGFSDVFSYTDHVDDIGWLASTGISEGFPDGTFRPMAGVARQDMAAFLYRLAGSPSYTPSASAKAAFSDVDSSTPHYKEVLWLAETGISEGFPDGTFRGMSTVARQDMAAFLRRTYDYMTGGASEGWTASSSVKKSFSDVSSATDHAEDIWWLASTGISEGFPDGTYRGLNSVVRQDMAAFLHRLGNLSDSLSGKASMAIGSGAISPREAALPVKDTDATRASGGDWTLFSDVDSGTSHAKEIGWLASTGISEGFPDGTFRPMAGVARQDMAAFLYRLAGSPSYTPSASAKAAFSDVDSSTPHYKEVLWLAETGISEGFPDGTFRGMSTVARQDMAAFLRRTYDYMTGGASEGWTASSSWRSCFADVTSSTDHAEDIWWLAAMGITTGFSDHTYRGTSSVVRQDMAAFLFRTANCEGEEIPCDDQPIMGSSVVTASQLVAYYKASGCAYPSAIYSGKGAASIEDFAQTVAEEAAAEGVRAEVVFCQAMHETGWLQFGGDVKAEQCNFAGLGATGGVAGATFPDVRTGIRAQVQHLKAYASTESLVNDCVDPRFDLVERGCAPYLSGLSGRWAVGDSYGQKIASMVDDLCMA